jgi:hypothetical protein
VQKLRPSPQRTEYATWQMFTRRPLATISLSRRRHDLKELP